MDLQNNLLNHNTFLLNEALSYASHLLPIIPLYEALENGKCSCGKEDCSSIGKHPRVKNGLKEATTDLQTIKDWWTKWPNANIGILTGSTSGKLVLDIDHKNGGFDSLATLEAEHGPLLGAKVRSGGNGLHFYFDIDQGLHLRNKVNLLPGIDVRAEGGYIVAPPSRHASGNLYIWEAELFSSTQIPAWLLNLLQAPKKVEEISLHQNGAVGPGARNNFLAGLAGNLVKSHISSSAIEQILLAVNTQVCSPSLDNSEVLQIAQSISRYSCEHLIWGELKDLPETNHNVPEMDASFLPSSLQTWIIDCAERMQVPYEFIAIPAIVGISSIIGRKFRIQPKQNDNWTVVPNLWGGIVSRPGTFKSPAIAEALKPLEHLVVRENNQFVTQQSNWEIEKSIQEATLEGMKEQLIKCIKKGNLDEADALKERLKAFQQESSQKAPTCKRLKTNDATIEKLVELLLENPNGLLVVRDELAGWLVSLNKYGREGDRELYLEAWNGYGSYTVDRIGRGTVHVPSLCLSILGGIQPDKLEKCITNSLDSNDDGLLQRFQLLIYPEIRGKWKNHDTSPDLKAQQRVFNLVEQIYDLTPKEECGFQSFHFDRDAQEIFNTYREDLEGLLRSGTIENHHYEGHLSKYRSLVPALALIFEMLDKADKTISISASSVALAIKWTDYLNEHAKKVYHVSSYKNFESIQTFKKRLLDGKIKDGDTIRSITRKYWENLNTQEQVEKAITFFIEHNWIQVVEQHRNCRPTRTLRIHPELLG